MKTKFHIILIVTAFACSAALSAPPAPTYSAVQAIFAQRCLDCHNANEGEGDFVMETYASLMKGGEKGVDIIAGKASESRLVKQIEHQSKPFMPPPKKAPQLAASEIATIRAWIDAGALGPSSAETASAAKWTPTLKPKVAVKRGILSLAYDSTKNLIAAARPGEVEIYSVADKLVAQHFANLVGDVNAVAFSADGSRLFAAGGTPGTLGRIWIWNTADFSAAPIVLQGHADAIYSLAISPDGKTLATGSYDQKIAMWNIASEAPPRMLVGHNGAVFGLAFRNDGKVLASVSADRTLKLWDVETGARLDTRPESTKDQYAVAWSPDGSHVAAAGVDNRIRIWKVSASALEGTNVLEQTTFAHDGAILRISWSHDGKYILSGADNNTLRLFNADTMKQTLTYPAQSDWPSALVLADPTAPMGKTPTSPLLAVVGRLDGSISFYDALTGKEIKPAPPVAPTVTTAYPPGIQRGKTARIRLTGKNLNRLDSVKIAEANSRVTAKLVAGRKAGEAFVELEAAENAPLTPFNLTVANSAGASAPIMLWVDDLPQLVKAADAQWTSDAIAVTTPVSVWGTMTMAGDIHKYSFAAKKGQTLIFDVSAQRFASKALINLKIHDASDRVVARATTSGDDPDPMIPFTAPADGTYVAYVNDASQLGKPECFYRMSIGAIPYVTGAYPLAIQAGRETEVSLVGINLPDHASLKITPDAKRTEMNVALPSGYRSRGPIRLSISQTPELSATAAAKVLSTAQPVDVPSSVSGVLATPGQAGYFRFDAKKGQAYTIETLAARHGWPTDTRIKVLYPDGKPVQRLQLRAVRDSNITFRGFDANGGGARFPNYLEMDLDQYVYMSGEVVRLFSYPNGPDSEYPFYSLNGKRRTYFDTTATAHALDEKVYVIEPHAVGEKLNPNGLPVFPLYYENDDESTRSLGADSRLSFTAPADGSYIVKVDDTRGFGGAEYLYRLTVRPAKPDFTAKIGGYTPTIPAGSGREFSIRLDRIDEFDGPVQIDISSPGAGFSISSPIVVQPGYYDATGTIYAAVDAGKSTGPLKVTATATIDGKKVTRELDDLAAPMAGPKLQARIALESSSSPASQVNCMQEIILTPGKMSTAWIRVDRNGYDKPMSFDMKDLPHGVFVADVGLNGVTILKDQHERQIFIQCAPWVAPMKRPAHLRLRDMGNPTTPPIMIIVPEQSAAR